MRQFTHQTRSQGGPTETTGRPTDSSRGAELSRVHSALLLAPCTVSTIYLGLAVAVGPALFDTGASGGSRVVAFVLLGSLLHLAGYATIRLDRESHRMARRANGWHPDSRLYVGGGAVALLGLRLCEMIVTGRSVSAPMIYFLGNAVVAVPLASIVAGPVYWLNRRRTAGR